MLQITPNSPTLLPRHYYQVALDFSRLSAKITTACNLDVPPIFLAVKDPATTLLEWDTAFQQYTRPLVRIFHHLTTHVLGTARHIKITETVRALVPLEQQVYRLLTLRKIVQRQPLPKRWQRGQALFLSRIDKILAEIEHILRYFNTVIVQSENKTGRPTRHIWDREIECRTESQAFYAWCQGRGCSVFCSYSLMIAAQDFAQYWLNGMKRLFYPKMRSLWCNF
jgi:hypothetical protein